MPLGFLITVYRLEHGSAAPTAMGAPTDKRLAVWQTGLLGLNWLNDLVEQGNAIFLGGNGYPLEYAARAQHIVPRLRDQPPEASPAWTFDEGDAITSEWPGKTTKDIESMDACRPDEWLLIRAWDAS